MPPKEALPSPQTPTLTIISSISKTIIIINSNHNDVQLFWKLPMTPLQHNTFNPVIQRPATPRSTPGTRSHPQSDPYGHAAFLASYHPPRSLLNLSSIARSASSSQVTEVQVPDPAPNMDMASPQAPAPQQPRQLGQQQEPRQFIVFSDRDEDEEMEQETH
ncbi:hypothetical protein BGX29_003412 [Mortierella sp. GBA35]|nr:hypothetical protein BGX29_003412 [Mortierella sp. GBA35]